MSQPDMLGESGCDNDHVVCGEGGFSWRVMDMMLIGKKSEINRGKSCD